MNLPQKIYSLMVGELSATGMSALTTVMFVIAKQNHVDKDTVMEAFSKEWDRLESVRRRHDAMSGLQ